MSRRHDAKRVALETYAILEAEGYEAPSGRYVRIEPTPSILYTPEDRPPHASIGERRTRVEVRNETTIVGARDLFDEHGDVVALNFASARKPGGGWLVGSIAQEESLARASGLYTALVDSPYYEFHVAQRDAHYSDHMIYSPDVPVFRTDDGALLEEPWRSSFITSPAVNLGELGDANASRVPNVMRRRIRRILDVAAAHDHRHVVLGAFGCGVFRNDPDAVAGWFSDALDTTHVGVFAHVRFSVLDAANGANIEAFETAFGTRIER